MTGQSLWFVAVLFYVYDSISVRDRRAVLRYSIDGVTAMLMMPSVTIGKHQVFVPNPLRPDHCDLVLTSRKTAELSSVDRYLIGRASGIYLTHQLVAVGALVILFVLTPLLAIRMDLLHACLISVAITYWLCAFHWIEMWRNRKLLGIDAKAFRSDILHVLLCPPNAVNCARRVAGLRYPRYPVLPTLRAFSRYDAEKYEEQFRPLGASA